MCLLAHFPAACVVQASLDFPQTLAHKQPRGLLSFSSQPVGHTWSAQVPGPPLTAFQSAMELVPVLGRACSLHSQGMPAQQFWPLSFYAAIKTWAWLVVYPQTPCSGTLSWGEGSMFSQSPQCMFTRGRPTTQLQENNTLGIFSL